MPARSDTRFGCVRYGNVVGSRGSVIPLFLEQRKTRQAHDHRPAHDAFLDHARPGRAVRDSAAIERMHGGEIFVPKIPSMSIMDLAEGDRSGLRGRDHRHPPGREAARGAGLRGRSAEHGGNRRHVRDPAGASVVEGANWERASAARRLPLRQRHKSDWLTADNCRH